MTDETSYKGPIRIFYNEEEIEGCSITMHYLDIRGDNFSGTSNPTLKLERSARLVGKIRDGSILYRNVRLIKFFVADTTAGVQTLDESGNIITTFIVPISRLAMVNIISEGVLGDYSNDKEQEKIEMGRIDEGEAEKWR